MWGILMGESLEYRRLESELMDSPALAPDQHVQALRGLESINRWSRCVCCVWPTLADLARRYPERPLRVLDLATGAGDIPIGIGERARRLGLQIQVAGCDRSPVAAAHAMQRAQETGVDVNFFVLDALQDDLPDGYDVILCSLFLHHLDDAQALQLLARMRDAAGRMVLVSDLLRTYAGLFLVKYVTPLLTRSQVVRVDGLQSVRAAFTLPEVGGMAGRAGLDGFKLEPQWPCRFLLKW